MKKILLFIVFPLLMQSCLFEDKDYFEESASERIESKISGTKTILSSQSKGWILHYFPRLSYGGHNYAISFSDEQAKIACETEVVGTNIRVGDPAYSDSCLYDVISEQGAILSFNTYSKLMHQFRNPSSVAYQGLGGDYEFILTNVEANEIKLTGKTTKHTMRMFPIPNSYTSKESYLEAVQKIADVGKLGSYILYYEGKLVDSITGTQRGRYLSYSYDKIEVNTETGKNDTVSATATIPLIFTPEGFIVYHDKIENVMRNISSVKKSKDLLPVFDTLQEYTEFTYDEANSKFVSKDGKIEFAKIPLPDFNIRIVKLMETNLLVYVPEEESACSAFDAIWNTAATNLGAAYGSLGVALSDITIGYDLIMESDKYALTFWCGAYNATFGLDINLVTGTTNQISISPLTGNLNWGPFGPYLSSIVAFFVTNSPWILEPDDEEIPLTIKLVSATNPDLWINLTIE
jgi:hypothetical protein